MDTVTSALPIGAQELEALVRRQVEAAPRAREDGATPRRKKMAIIYTRGGLDDAYPPLILSTTAAAYGWDVGVFCTFYGLNLIHKKKHRSLKVSALGKLGMPMPMPNLVSAVPGMTSVTTGMMKWRFKKKGMASIEELLQLAVESGVKLVPCGSSIHVFGYKQEDFIDGVQPIGGAASFVSYASDADVTLFI